MQPNRFENGAVAASCLLAGNATVTLKSERSGARFTYKVRKPENARSSVSHFVSVMTGSDNEFSFQYLGVVRSNPGGQRFETGKPGKAVDAEAPSAVAFAWAFPILVNKGRIPAGLEVWHEGKCGRCGRTLTVPESLALGLGPECASKMEA